MGAYMERVHAVVLAAGKGKRMKSDLPKVLHRVSGQALVTYVLETLRAAGVEDPIIVVGHGAEGVRAIGGPRARFVDQVEQRGTGHAVMQALPLLPQQTHQSDPVLVLYGDTPLLTPDTIRALLEQHRSSEAAVTMLTAELSDPTGYGRIIRDGDGRVQRIVEDADASSEEKQVREINAGTYVYNPAALREALKGLVPHDAQGEYYITDTVSWLLSRGRTVSALLGTPEETMGINSRRELAQVEAVMRRRILEGLMDQGVTIIDPLTTYVHAGVVVG
ncbi:MAG: NTP transferase domain-containing protein, partial [bacterium]